MLLVKNLKFLHYSLSGKWAWKLCLMMFCIEIKPLQSTGIKIILHGHQVIFIPKELAHDFG